MLPLLHIPQVDRTWGRNTHGPKVFQCFLCEFTWAVFSVFSAVSENTNHTNAHKRCFSVDKLWISAFPELSFWALWNPLFSTKKSNIHLWNIIIILRCKSEHRNKIMQSMDDKVLWNCQESDLLLLKKIVKSNNFHKITLKSFWKTNTNTFHSIELENAINSLELHSPCYSSSSKISKLGTLSYLCEKIKLKNNYALIGL